MPYGANRPIMSLIVSVCLMFDHLWRLMNGSVELTVYFVQPYTNVPRTVDDFLP
jgi:hypothetical protein